MSGKIYLVGAGSGDLELITVKGLRLIRQADVIIYDNLANSNFLLETKDGCEKIFVGKMAGNHTLTQDKINELLVKKAEENKTVVRLKGGDSYVFGRGGEEGEILFDNNIEFEVVPGITSAIGGLAYAGIPITHRDMAADFHVYTGHFKDDMKNLDFKTIAQLTGTIVFLMGIANLDKIAGGLIENGKNPKTKAAIIRNASLPNQRTWTCTLEELSNVKDKYKIKPPALIVIGEVVTIREKLNFFENKKMFGKKVIVTRSRNQSSGLVKALEELGAEVFQVPTIKIENINSEELNHEIENIDNYNYIIFTSENGAKIFFDQLNKKYDSRKLFGKKIVSIGKGTDKIVRKYGVKSDFVPERYIGEEIVELLKTELKTTDKILIPRSLDARTMLVDELSLICSVKEIKTYKTIKEEIENIEELKEEILKNNVDYITFTSSSTVINFFEIFKDIRKEDMEKIKLISIGPVTSGTIKEFGYMPYREAVEYSIDGIIKELVKLQ